MSSKADIIKDMYYFYLSNFQHTPQSKELTQEIIKQMFEECVEPYVAIKEKEQPTVLQNGFSPDNNDLELAVPKNYH